MQKSLLGSDRNEISSTGKSWGFKTFCFDTLLTPVNNSEEISGTDKISLETSDGRKEEISEKSSGVKNSKEFDSTSRPLPLSDVPDQRNIEPALFLDIEDPEVPDYQVNDYKSFFCKNKASAKIKRSKYSAECNNIKKKRYYNKSNRMNKKELADFDKWAKAFNKHCQEVEAYQLCID